MNTQLIHKLFDVATFEEDRIRYNVEWNGEILEKVYFPYIPLQYSGEDVRLSITPKQIEKFAELIVRDCAKTIESQDVDPSFKNRMSWAIKTKFGIES